MRKMLLVLAAAALLLLSACGRPAAVQNATNQTGAATTPQGLTSCTPESRNAEACIEIYQPVCGLKGGANQTYSNSCFACMDRSVSGYIEGECAGAVQPIPPADEQRLIPCSERSRQGTVCTMEYNPVCAEVDNGIRCIRAPCPSTDKRTYGNACQACQDQRVYGYTPGACTKETSNNPQPRTPPTTPPGGSLGVRRQAVCATDQDRQHAANLGYECVASCPEQSYMTQIGLRMCIPTYDRSAFLQWNSCTRSTDCGTEEACAYALISTAGGEVDWRASPTDRNGQPAQALRCVPREYADYLIHTSGLTSVDEDGRMSTVIA